MTEFVTIIKKHGALGVLALWLWFTNARVEKLEEKLYDCYENSAIIDNSFKSNFKEQMKLFAVLPKQISYDIKKLRKQTTKS